MRNFIQEGNGLNVKPAAAVLSGQAVLYGKMLGVHATSAAQDEETVAMFKGVYSIPKVAATAITFGDELYWDNAAKVLTKTVAGNTYVGCCAKDAIAADTEVHILLK
jgi:predicted RecA/RadA family phage recombinase